MSCDNEEMQEAKYCRNEKLDVLRGIAIILVMLGHGVGLMIKKGLPHWRGYLLVYDMIYTFHMPLFFMISGYVYKCYNEKISKIIIKNVISLYVPYLFFNYLYWAERTIASVIFGLQLDRNDYPSGIKLLWMGDGATWFLLSMLLVKTVFGILDMCLSKATIVSIFSLLFWLSCIFPQNKLLEYLHWGIFFSIGYVISRWSVKKEWVNVIYVVCINMFLFGIERYILFGVDKFVKIFIGTSIFIMYMYIKNISHMGLLALFGRNSMVIYIVHGLSQYICYYAIVELFHIKVPIIVLGLIIILQILLAFLIIILFTRVRCLHWIQIIFYPYKYMIEKKGKMNSI